MIELNQKEVSVFRREVPKFDIAAIYLLKGKAYLPTQVRFEMEGSIDSEPVYCCDIHPTEIVKALEIVLETQKQRLPLQESMKEIYEQAASVILRATKLRSWKQLAKVSASYMIVWDQDKIALSISQLDSKGRFEFPKSKKQVFPKNTSLDKLVEVILRDYHSRNISE